MIEQVMYFALGACVAGLIALLALPAFWARAVRLARLRLEASAPMNLEELTAQNDLARAEFAVERRRFQQQAEAQLALRAQTLLEIGALGQHIATIETALDDLGRAHSEIALEKRELEAISAAAVGAAGALEIELHDSIGLSARLREELEERKRLLVIETAENEARARVIRTYEIKTANLMQEISDLTGDREALRLRLALREEHLLAANEEHERLTHDLLINERRMAQTRSRLETEAQKSASYLTMLETARETADSLRQSLATTQARHAQEVRALEAQVAELEAMRDELRAALINSDKTASERLEILRVENAHLKGVLSATRAPPARTDAAQTPEIGELRALLLDLGEKVADLDQPPQSQEAASLTSATGDE